MTIRELTGRMARPRGIAVVGASPRSGSLGERPVRYLRTHGYTGPLYPVNPRHPEVAGLPCFSTLSAIPGPVDVALIAVPAAAVPPVVAQCAAREVPLAVVLSSGFAEAGDAEAQQELRGLIGSTRLLGPNCQGYLAPGVSASFSAAFEEPLGPADPRRAILSQSGALGFSLLHRLRDRDIHCGWAISTGNEADLTVGELLEGIDAREVLCYVEGVRDPGRFAGALRQARAAGRLVVVVEGGRTPAARRAALAHTAAESGAPAHLPDAIWLSDLDEAGDVLEAFRTPLAPAGGRFAIVSTSGGLGVLLADEMEAALADLAPDTMAALAEAIPAFGSPRNPVDLTAQVLERSDMLVACLREVAADPGVDAIVVGLTMLVGAHAHAVAQTLAELQIAKPLFVVWTAGERSTANERSLLRAAGIPVFGSPARLTRALGRWAAWHGRGHPAVPA